METNFRHQSARDFKLGDVVVTKSLILCKVVGIVSERYVQVRDGDGNIRVTIPAHGELRHWEP